MRRETQNVVLVLFGGALLKIAFTGLYLRYVKPSLQPWLIAAGVVMVLLALVSIVRDIRAPHAHADHDHDHHGSSQSTWLLVLPVLAIFLIAPPALGSDSVDRSGSRNLVADKGSDTATQQFPPLPAREPVDLRMSDFAARAAWDASGSLNGRQVRLSGFVVRRGGDVHLVRLVIACCAADSLPVKARLSGADLDRLANDQWIEITGRLRPGSGTEATQYIATLDVSTLRTIPTPQDPYEY